MNYRFIDYRLSPGKSYRDGEIIDYKYCITDQTHLDGNFTPTGSLYSSSNGVKLISVNAPGHCKNTSTFSVRGVDRSQNNRWVSITLDEVDPFIIAVFNYNKEFGGKIVYALGSYGVVQQ